MANPYNSESWTKYSPQRPYMYLLGIYDQVEAKKKADWLNAHLVTWEKNKPLSRDIDIEDLAYAKNSILLKNIINEAHMSQEHIAAFTYCAEINPESVNGFSKDDGVLRALSTRKFSSLSQLYQNCDARKVAEIINLIGPKYLKINRTFEKLPSSFQNVFKTSMQPQIEKAEEIKKEEACLVDAIKRYEIINLINKRFGVEETENLSIGEFIVSRIDDELLEPVYLFARDYEIEMPSGAKTFRRDKGGWQDLLEATKEVTPYYVESQKKVLSVLQADGRNGNKVRNFLYIPEISNCHESLPVDEKQIELFLHFYNKVMTLPNSEFGLQVQKLDLVFQKWCKAIQFYSLEIERMEVEIQNDQALAKSIAEKCLEIDNLINEIKASENNLDQFFEIIKKMDILPVEYQEKVVKLIASPMLDYACKDMILKRNPEIIKNELFQISYGLLKELLLIYNAGVKKQGEITFSKILEKKDMLEKLANQLKEAEARVKVTQEAYQKIFALIGTRFKSENPSEAQFVGRQEFFTIQGYTANGKTEEGSEARLWEEKKYEAMVVAGMAKLKSRPDILAMLLMVSPEDAPTFIKPDSDWGTGLNGKGKDGLARAYEIVRDNLLKMNIQEIQDWLEATTKAIEI